MDDPLYNIYSNLLIFVRDYRRYTFDQQSILEPHTFAKKMTIDHYIKLDCADESEHESERITVLLFKPDSKYLKTMPLFKKLLNGIHARRIITVSKEPLSKYIERWIETLDLSLKSYFHRHFLVEIPKGPFCSKHTILSPEEAKKVCEHDLMINPLSLPAIQVTDPQCIWINAQVGQIIRIDAPSDVAGAVVRYRLVVPNE